MKTIAVGSLYNAEYNDNIYDDGDGDLRYTYTIYMLKAQKRFTVTVS